MERIDPLLGVQYAARFRPHCPYLHIGSRKAADGSAKGPHVENETPAELNNWSGVYSSYGMQEHKYLLKFVV